MRERALASVLAILVSFAGCSTGDTGTSATGGAPAGGQGMGGAGTGTVASAGAGARTMGGAAPSGGGGATTGGSAGNVSAGSGSVVGGASGSGGDWGGSGGEAGSAGTPPTDLTLRAQLMQHCPYGGWSVSLPVGDYTRAELVARGFADNDVSSLRVAPGFEVVLYDDDAFGGDTRTIDAQTPCATSVDFNDRATSLRVRRKAGAPLGAAFVPAKADVSTTFFVISDTHADAPGDDANTHESHLLATARAVDKVAAGGKWPSQIGGRATGFDAVAIGAPGAGVVFTGDLIGYSQGPLEYPTFEKYFFQGKSADSIDFRAFVGLGNHDMDDPPAQSNPSYRAYAWSWLDGHHKGAEAPVPVTEFDAGSHSYSWDHGGVHFVQLNRFPGDTNAGLPNNLPFLKRDLEARAKDGRPVVLFHHFGFDAFGTEDRWWTAAQRAAYGDAVAPYNVATMVVGHSHFAHELFLFEEGSRADNRVVHVNNAKGENGTGNDDGNGSFAIVRITGTELWLVTCRWLDTSGNYELIAPYYRGPALLLK